MRREMVSDTCSLTLWHLFLIHVVARRAQVGCRADDVSTIRTTQDAYFIFLGSWYTMRWAYGLPSNMM